jgi:hypothetical protein
MSHSHNMPSNYHIATPGYEISHSHNMPFNYHIADPSNHHIGTPVYEISPSHNLPSHYHSATPESEVWSKQNDSPEGIALWVSHKKGRALLEGLAYNQSLIPFHIVRNLGERLETTRDAANSGRGTDSVLTYYRNVRTMANQTFDHTKQRVTMCKRAQAFYDLVQNPESNLTVVIHPSTPKPPTSGPWSSHGPNSQAGIPANSNSLRPLKLPSMYYSGKLWHCQLASDLNTAELKGVTIRTQNVLPKRLDSTVTLVVLSSPPE